MGWRGGGAGWRLGRGFGAGRRMQGYRYGPWGCRGFPWLPRRWWATPFYGGYAYPWMTPAQRMSYW